MRPAVVRCLSCERLANQPYHCQYHWQPNFTGYLDWLPGDLPPANRLLLAVALKFTSNGWAAALNQGECYC